MTTNTDNLHTGNEPTVYSRNPVELPDFVQDHLVIEQCYLNHDPTVQPIVELENLPDFALNSVEQRNKQWNDTKKCTSENLGDLSFDLTVSLEKEERGDRTERGERVGRTERWQRSLSSSSPARPRPLDLPDLDLPQLGSVGALLIIFSDKTCSG